MKKYILFLLLSIAGYGQTSTGQEQEFPYGILVPVSVLQVPTTTTWIGTFGADGTQGKVAPQNISIPQVPTNYVPTSATIGGHLDGINTKLGDLSGTTAGISTRLWFTADQTTITAGTFDLTNPISKGTAASHQQTVANDDNQKKYFTTDIIGQPFAMPVTFPQGIYEGNLSASTTPTNANQKFTVELYKCNNAGTPIASGVTGAVTGSLGVTVIMILDSGEITLANASVTNVTVSAVLGSGGFSINTGERVRYHVSAEKVGTAGGVINESVYYGTSYNSFLDVPVIYNSTSIKDVSTVTNGAGTVTDALNALDSRAPKQDIVFPATNLPAFSTFTGRSVFKGNANGASSYALQSLIITDNLDKVVAKFDNSGRLDLHDYSGQGAVMALYNMGTATIGKYSHFAFGARNTAGNLNTTNSINGVVTDPTTATMSSKIELNYMDNVDTSTGYSQPNKSVVISKNGLELPSIAITNATGLSLVNSASGSAPVQIKYFANNAVERGILEFSVNPTTPFQADLIYRTKGYDGIAVNDRLKIDGNTGAVTIPGTLTAGIKVRKISTNTTLSDTDNGTVILLTASCTVTLPNGLMSGFNVSFSTATGATLTYALGGSVTLINNAGTTMAQNLSHTIVNTGTSNEYLCAGSL